MRLDQAIQTFQNKLREAGVDNASLDVRLLTAHALGCDRVTLIADPDRVLTSEEFDGITAMIQRRANREPVARILGVREFWGLPFAMNHATLEPRPDSETLVQAVLDAIPKPQVPMSILDLGTGTGCLLLALLSEWPLLTGVGIDLSPEAVEQAAENAKTLDLSDRVHFKTGNWFDGTTDCFDLIISNPPYIPTSDEHTLEPEVKTFDPALALFGGRDGLDPYRHLIPQLSKHLNPSGSAFFEVGIHQAKAVADLMRDAGFESISITADLGGVERVVGGRIEG